MPAPTIRPLTPAEHAALDAARLNAVEATPYFARAIFRLVPVAAEGLGTFAVDRHWRLYLDPATMDQWGARLAGGVLSHEVGHVLRDHADRADALGNPDRDLWNLAGDAAINEHLIASGVPLPDGAVTPETLGLLPDGIEEDYYAALTTQGQPSPTGGEGDPGCGSGADAGGRVWELDPADDRAPGVREAAQEATRRAVAQDVLDNTGSTPGSSSAGLRRWAQTTLAPPQVDWRRQLRAAVRRAVAWSREGGTDYTYTRPGRRRIPRVLTPAMQTPKVSVAVVLDTSGSMTQDLLAAALTEVAGIVRATGSHGLTVVTVDTEPTVIEHVVRAEQINLVGGGGTDMRVGIETAREHRTRPDVIVVLTDGYTPWPEVAGREHLVIGLISPAGHAPDTPSWASTVHITA